MTNTLHYRLNKEINGQSLLNDISRMLEQSHILDPMAEKILTISLKTVTRDDHTPIPKLTYDESSCS